MSKLVDRAIRAAKLDVSLYEEVEADPRAFGQAIVVVVLSSIAAGIGSTGVAGMGGLIIGTLGALVGWFIWAFLTYVIGTKVLPEEQTHADVGQLLRTIGFSSAPGVIQVLGIIPVLGKIVVIVAAVWMVAAMVVAVRQALDYKSTLRAVAVCVIGWLVQAVVIGILIYLLGGVTQRVF
jgi:hypothetical protein